jgi:hypothetical protein
MMEFQLQLRVIEGATPARVSRHLVFGTLFLCARLAQGFG